MNKNLQKKQSIALPLLLLVRLRLFIVVSAVSGAWFRLFLELLLLIVLFSLKIDDLDRASDGGGAFVDESDVICELTFHGQASGGAFDTVS